MFWFTNCTLAQKQIKTIENEPCLQMDQSTTQMPKKNKILPKILRDVSITRSSASEYLTFVASGGDGGVEAVYADENVWLSQKMMGLLYNVETHTINYHLKKVFNDSELEEVSVIRNFRITAADGKSYDTKHYNLAAISISLSGFG